MIKKSRGLTDEFMEETGEAAGGFCNEMRAVSRQYCWMWMWGSLSVLPLVGLSPDFPLQELHPLASGDDYSSRPPTTLYHLEQLLMVLGVGWWRLEGGADFIQSVLNGMVKLCRPRLMPA